jgi:hypothetical protein
MTRGFSAISRIAHHVADIYAEISYAQRRMDAIRTTPDRYIGADHAPDSYPEFLFRTSGALLHEPSAAARARGRLVG